MALGEVLLRLKKSIKLYKTISPYLGNMLPIFIGIVISLVLALAVYVAIQVSNSAIYQYRIVVYLIFFFVLYLIWVYIFYAGLIKTRILKEIVELNKEGKTDETLLEQYKNTKFFRLIKKYPTYLLAFTLIPVILFIVFGLNIFLGSITTNTTAITLLNYLFTIIFIVLLPLFLDILMLPLYCRDFKVSGRDIKGQIISIITQFKPKNINKYLEKLVFCFAIIIIAYLIVLILSFLQILFLLLILAFLSYFITSCTDKF